MEQYLADETKENDTLRRAMDKIDISKAAEVRKAEEAKAAAEKKAKDAMDAATMAKKWWQLAE